ncbi:hypothetical protein TNCT_620881 [Trichonephila clavata]|uniref:Uncharacterized protein n=1 Tax=Trichonephila clavata TaxID=2740835 RepID=A0A8X6KW32_TRICU|nr:hypothetical protein TNCT_620881 [Trichonephila clavata]
MEEAEKFYIIKGLKENKAIEMQLQSSRDIQDLKEKMKILDIQEKQNPTSNCPQFIHPKYPVKRVPNNPTQLAHRQHHGRSGQYQHPVNYLRNNVFSPQRPTFFPHRTVFPSP